MGKVKDDYVTPDKRVVEALITNVYKNVEAACEHMDPEKLTEDQKFALAMQAGVEFTITYDNGLLRYTTVPCSFSVEDGKWVVRTLRGIA